MIDAMGLALLAQNEGLWAIPGNVVSSEFHIALLLKYLCCSFEVLDKTNLTITLWATLIIAVGPKFKLNTLSRMGKGLPPIQVHIKVQEGTRRFLGAGPKPSLGISRRFNFYTHTYILP